MDDLISRQDAVKSMTNAIWHYPNEMYAQLNSYEMAEALAKDGLMFIPSAQKKGHWIDCTSSEHMKCSECGDRAPMYWDANRQEYDEWYSPFCPNCGADMREETND